MTLRCVAVDDEPVALEIIRSHAEKIPYLRLLETFTSGSEALAFVREHPVDVVFLDIRMPDVSGLELAELFGGRTRVVFTTAHAEFAVQGFEVAAEDYLLKPIGFARFQKACDRLLTLRPEPSSRLFVRDGYDWVGLDTRDLLYIESEDNYLIFVAAGRKTLTRMTLTEALKRLPAQQFLRIHKSYIISLDHLEKVERHQVVVGGAKIPLSAAYREALLARLG